VKTFKAKQAVELEIQSLGHQGEGVGKLDGYTIFVDDALPGEVVSAKLSECHKRYAKASLLSIRTASPHRVLPPCPLFGRCGGCQIMHLSYEKQLEMKRQKVIDALKRIGKIDSVEVLACSPSPLEFHYRNKIQLPVRPSAQGISLGLYERGSHRLVELPKCYIHCDLGEEVYTSVRKILQTSNISAYDPVEKSGILRHVLIKSAVKTGQTLVILVTNETNCPQLTDIATKIMQQCPQVKGVVQNIHKGKENVILGSDSIVLKGDGSIKETICHLTFKVSPTSFFQVNPRQAEQLYMKALELADLSGTETVLDAYCGVGTLSLIFAQKARQVIGVEYVKAAIEDAKENARINNITNAQFFAADAAHYIQSLSKMDIVLLNPPRKGCDLLFLQGIQKVSPKTIIYISCDPATLARDLAHLKTFGYNIDFIQPFDMFPQTAHVETIVKLKNC
jgi:23S rRNA (uracil1939-C5)-methyltransferase